MPRATGLTLFAILSSTTLYCLYKCRSLVFRKVYSFNNHDTISSKKGKLLFVSQTGTAKTLAYSFHSLLASNNLNFEIVDTRDYEPEDLCNEHLLIIIASTWEDGKPPSDSKFFAHWLEESIHDFRVGSLLLSKCKFAVFGVGSRAYGESFNAVARDFSRMFKQLGATEIEAFGEGDVDDGDLNTIFDAWSMKVIHALNGSHMVDVAADNGLSHGERDILNPNQMPVSHDEDYVDSGNGNLDMGIVDLEDVVGKGPMRKSLAMSDLNTKDAGPREMVTPVIRSNLEKQGYKIVGSHSGVKICRWTKSQLRGRGGCYKHSFYGIESHRCMEATPSLACANKCVFCWRHHTNPVGKKWQWKMDNPTDIVNSMIDMHMQMIKQMKGVPGVTAERLNEGLRPRHCALSLVGEPIMYPEINKLVNELHQKRISTFLVTNAQFPESIEMLQPITQLYVSVDAATKDSLKAIDRPLFGDFWDRFIRSLKAIKNKQQRTVYRLTLVKMWNTEDVDAYVQLLSIGQPDFVEIKGVTYCGSTATSKLTMENVPWHSDVKAFSEAMAEKTKGLYEVACEHEHSCCVLLAKADYKLDGRWFTWIDFEKFHDLVAAGKSFSSKDYLAATPIWAVYGAKEGGFDPSQSRYKKERHHISSE